MTKRPLPIAESRAFPMKGVTIDTFDEKMNGIQEHSLGFAKVVPLIKDEPEDTYADKLRDFAKYLLKQGDFKPDEKTRFFHIKTNTYKKISISCLVKMKGKRKCSAKNKDSKK